MYKLIAFLVIILASSCGTKSTTLIKKKIQGLPQNIELGTSSVSDVKAIMGEPIRTYTVNEENSVVSNFTDNKSVKFEDNIAKAFFRNPIREEKYLQYWLQKWKSVATTKEKILSSKNAHGQYEYQLICKADQTTIVYNDESGMVKRVIYYEK